MREIKFRGYNGINWCYSQTFFHDKRNNADYMMLSDYIDDWTKVLYLGQYTGLYDKNGWEIYEGDIVQVKGVAPCEKDFRGVVKFDECAFWIVDEERQDAVKLFDEVSPRIVVGNIYDVSKGSVE